MKRNLLVLSVLSIMLLMLVPVASGFNMTKEVRKTSLLLIDRGMFDKELVKSIVLMKMNLIGMRVPLGKIFGNDDIQINVALESGETVDLCVSIVSGVISSLEVCEAEFEPDAIADTTVGVLAGMQGSDGEILKALKDKKITFDAIGAKNKIKYAALRFV